jgi:hypothetical protein
MINMTWERGETVHDVEWHREGGRGIDALHARLELRYREARRRRRLHGSEIQVQWWRDAVKR